MKVLLVVESGDRLWMDGVSVERWQGVLWEETPASQRRCTLFVYKMVVETEASEPLSSEPLVGDGAAR